MMKPVLVPIVVGNTLWMTQAVNYTTIGSLLVLFVLLDRQKRCSSGIFLLSLLLQNLVVVMFLL
jgi:hypothetical protein